jgi:hypothetical protein
MTRSGTPTYQDADRQADCPADSNIFEPEDPRLLLFWRENAERQHREYRECGLSREKATAASGVNRNKDDDRQYQPMCWPMAATTAALTKNPTSVPACSCQNARAAELLLTFRTGMTPSTTQKACSTLRSRVRRTTTGVAEIGLIINPPVRNAIASTPIFHDIMVVTVGPSHPLAKRRVVSLRDLAEFPFVFAEPSFGLRQQIDRVFARHKFKPEIFCVTNSIALVKEVAGIGRQCTLLPRFAVQREVESGNLCAIATARVVRGMPATS